MSSRTPPPSSIEARRAISPAFNVGYTMRRTLIGLEEMQAGAAAADAEHRIQIATAEKEYLRRQAAIELESSAPARDERCFTHDLNKP